MNDLKIKVDYMYYTPAGRRKYNYDYGMDKFLKTTGKLTVPASYLYSGTQNNQSYTNYYGLKVDGLDIDHTESFKEVENKYDNNNRSSYGLGSKKST